jgi:hypothetical protein
MSHRPLDPRRCNVTIDNNASDRSGSARDVLIDRLLDLEKAGKVNLVVPQGVRRESQHPNTPAPVRATMAARIYTLPVERTSGERAELRRVQAILQGNAMPGKHAADSDHLFEAGKYGGGYFVTNDRRILDKRSELAAVLPPTLNIVTIEELFVVFDDYEAGRRL